MCGLMPSDSGYDLNLYPNLARYRTPQRDINDNTHSATNDNTYNDTNNNTYYPATDSDTYSYTAYGPCPINNPYQPHNQLNPLAQEEVQAQEVDDDDEEEFPFRHQTMTTPSTPASTLPSTTKKPALPTIFVRLFASDILMWGDEWRRCPACFGGKVCLVKGRCIENGTRVKVFFLNWCRVGMLVVSDEMELGNGCGAENEYRAGRE
jgi:hypothetical protein